MQSGLGVKVLAREAQVVPYCAKLNLGRGYFAASSGTVTDDVIMQYIAEQDLEERAHDDDFTLAP